MHVNVKRRLNLQNLSKGGPYSHGIVSNNFLFVSGQASDDPGKVPSFEVQFKNTMTKLKKILESANASFTDVVKISIFLAKREDFQTMNRLFVEYFKEDPPARTTVVTGFVESDILVEIDLIAEVKM